MPNTIGSLVIDLVANTASFATQLNGAVKSVEDTVSKIKTAFGGLGAIFSIASIADLTKDALAFGDELQKATAKTGLQATAISQLAFAAKQVNIDLPELVSTFDKMEKSISSATTGTAASKITFDALGISLAQLKTLSPDQQFEEIANQISKLADPADKARAALTIFGRAGADLLPLFEQGAAGIEAARQKAVDFGASLDTDQIAKLATANTAVKDLGASFSALASTLVAKVAPSISGFFDSITNAVTDNKIPLLTKQIETLQGQLAYAQGDGTGGPAVAELQGQIARAQIALQGAKLSKQISDSLAKPGDLIENAAPGFLPDIQPIDVTAQKIQIGAMAKFYQDMDDATKTGGEKLLDDTAKLQAQLDLLVKDGVISLSDSFNRLNSSGDSQGLSEFFATNAAQIQASIKGTQEQLAQSFASNSAASKLSADNMKKDFDATANFAVQSATSIQNSFAEAFDDIGTKGLGGLVADFINAFRKILDQAAAFDLAKALGITAAFQNQGSGSAVGSIFSGLGSLFGLGGTKSAGTDASTAATIGFATGGSFNVGGSGGTDSQLVKFKATPGENVTVTTPGQAAGGAITFAPSYNIGSGVSRSDVLSACAATQRATISEMTRLIRGGAYA